MPGSRWRARRRHRYREPYRPTCPERPGRRSREGSFMPKFATILASLLLVLATALAQPADRIDVQRPDAPELAAYGEHAIGVRTIDVVDEGRLNILAATAGEEIPLYDRPLTLEVW